MHGPKAIGRYDTFGSLETFMYFARLSTIQKAQCASLNLNFFCKKSMLCLISFSCNMRGQTATKAVRICANVKPVYLDDDGSKSMLCIAQNCK